MARKNLLEGLMNQNADAALSALTTPATRRPLKGAIGAVSQSIEALKARSLLDIETHLIDAGGLHDRLDTNDADDAALLASIQTYGQQVPVMMRPHPDEHGRYQIVYGRRRVLAMRKLGQPVKALVRELDDSALVMAQGQENTARKNLSFIEKANFAAQMRAAGYERKAMCDALSIDKTVISRMLLVVNRLGVDLIQSIGSAPAVGRDRWAQLADLVETNDTTQGSTEGITPATLTSALTALPHVANSDMRFDAALQQAQACTKSAKPAGKARKKSVEHTIKRRRSNDLIASVARKEDRIILTLPRFENAGFEEWLIENLQSTYEAWAADDPDKEPDS